MLINENELKYSSVKAFIQIFFGGVMAISGLWFNWHWGYMLLYIVSLLSGFFKVGLRKNLEKYRCIIEYETFVPFEVIVAETGDDVETVVKNLEWMISYDFLMNAEINKAEKCICAKAIVGTRNENEYEEVVCEYCKSEIQFIKGKDVRCSFCGAPLGKYKKDLKEGEKDNEME